MIRNAVIVTNVCIGKCIDGVAKLVTKTDLVGLKSKNKEAMVKESEEFLTQAWNDVMISQLTPAVKYKIFGVTCMRVTLLLCKKEKQGKEGKTYTLQEIKDMFGKDLQAGAPPTLQAQAASSTTTPKDEKAISINEGKDSMFLAKKALGLEIGSTYIVKDQPSSRIWSLNKVTQDGIQLVFTPLLEPTKTLTLSFKADEITTYLKATKSKAPVLMEAAVVEGLLPVPDDSETMRCNVFIKMMELYQSHDLDASDFLLQQTPKLTMYANHDFKPKYAQLLPVPEKVSNVVMKEPNMPKYGKVKFQNTMFYILPPKPLKFPKPEDANQTITGMLAPFWVCNTKDEDGCLELKMFSFGDIEIEILINPNSVNTHDLLAVKEVKQVVNTDGEPPKKRAKK